ncbi:MAG TPA: hypothetical protein VGF79_03755 [Bacteroidia bacterium]
MNQPQLKYENEHLKLEIRGEILEAVYKKGVKIDKKIAEELVKARKDFTGGRQFLFLIVDDGIVSMDKPAREYLSSEDATDGIIATAFIQNSLYSIMLINFFIGITRHKIKVKAFTDKNEATNWLKNSTKN